MSKVRAAHHRTSTSHSSLTQIWQAVAVLSVLCPGYQGLQRVPLADTVLRAVV